MEGKEVQSSFKTAELSNGETIAYYESGTGSKVILLLHGALSSFNFWIHYMPFLPHGYRFIAPDFRGHGESSYNNPQRSHDDNVEDIKLLVDKLGLKKFIL